MWIRSRLGVVGMLFAVVCYAVPVQGSKRPLTLVDAMETTRAVSPVALSYVPVNPVVVSPDGSRYIVMLVRGDVGRNGVWVELIAGRLTSLESAAPRTVIKLFTPALAPAGGLGRNLLVSAGNAPVWTNDDTVSFLWCDEKEVTQVVAVDVNTGELTYRTVHATDVRGFWASRNGNLVYWSGSDASDAKNSKLLAEGFAVSNPDLVSLLLGAADGTSGITLMHATETFVATSAHPHARPLHTTSPPYPRHQQFPITESPDGLKAIVFGPPTQFPSFPKDWEAITDPYVSARIRAASRGDTGNSFQVVQPYVLDFRSTKTRPLWNAPGAYLGNRQHVAWSTSGRSLILAPTFLPPGIGNADGLAGTAVAEVEVASGRFYVLPVAAAVAARGISDVRWVDDDRVTLELTAGSLMHFVRRRGRWVLDPAVVTRPAALAPIRVEVRQDLNTPPKLYAVELSSDRTVMIHDLNPRLEADFQLARVEEVEWTDSRGESWNGHLYYPVQRTPDHRYPLVIQTHGIARRAFSLGGKGNYGLGPGVPGYAAQVLAGRNFAVLQMQDKPTANFPRGEEPKAYALGYEGAIEYLTASGLVDRKRVGLMGFSRTGWHVEYAITHSSFLFAAALAIDHMDGSYSQAAVVNWNFQSAEDIVGASPFGPGLTTWLEHSPAFNVECSSTPLQLQSTSLGLLGLVSRWEMFSRLRKLNKPVELYVIPDIHHGSHAPQNPRQLLASQERAIDWWEYWLNDHIDPAPRKSSQYEAWVKLRTAHEPFSASAQCPQR